jgi:hypothetical protein
MKRCHYTSLIVAVVYLIGLLVLTAATGLVLGYCPPTTTTETSTTVTTTTIPETTTTIPETTTTIEETTTTTGITTTTTPETTSTTEIDAEFG